MLTINDTIEIPMDAISLRGIRSGGPGGQHVNKVATGVELRFDLKSGYLSKDIVERIVRQHPGYVSRHKMLRLTSTSYRSQTRNRERVLDRFKEIIAQACKPPKKRKPTKPTKASQQKRLASKKKASEIKALRKKPPIN